MSTVWFKNYIGLHCSDYELLQVPRPKLEFGIHVTFKTFQLGVLAGSIAGPMINVLRYGVSSVNNQNKLSSAAVDGGLYGAAVGLLAGPVVTVGFYNQQAKIETYDQCYRLRYNSPQLTIDRITVLGALLGAGLAGGPGLVAGSNVGILCGLLFNGVKSIHLKI